jgi:hypothetical protein
MLMISTIHILVESRLSFKTTELNFLIHFPLKSFNAFIHESSWIFHNTKRFSWIFPPHTRAILKFPFFDWIRRNKMKCFHGTFKGFMMFYIFSFKWRKLCGKVMFAHLQIIICSTCVCATRLYETNKLKDFEGSGKGF